MRRADCYIFSHAGAWAIYSVLNCGLTVLLACTKVEVRRTRDSQPFAMQKKGLKMIRGGGGDIAGERRHVVVDCEAAGNQPNQPAWYTPLASLDVSASTRSWASSTVSTPTSQSGGTPKVWWPLETCEGE